MREPGKHDRWLPCWLVSIFVVSVLVGVLVTPAIYNGLIWLGRHVPAWSGLRELLFERVANRVVMLTVLAGALFMARRAGMANFAASGFTRGAGWGRSLGGGFSLGVGSMLVVLAGAWLTGAYVPRSGGWGGGFWLRLPGYLVGALLVGYLEEWLFRGVFFGALWKAFGLWTAAVSSSVLFSLVHFARTENPVGVVHGRWYSGFELMPYMFTYDDIYWGYEGFKMFTLFFMGLCLCFFYARQRHLYFIIGLHAGWVWLLRMSDYVFVERERSVLLLLFGPTANTSKSGAALLLGVLFTVAAFRYYRRGVPAPGDAL